MTKPSTKIVVVRLGKLVDTCDNYLAWMNNPAAPMQMKLDAVSHGLTSVREEIKTMYLKLGGEDNWNG